MFHLYDGVSILNEKDKK